MHDIVRLLGTAVGSVAWQAFVASAGAIEHKTYSDMHYYNVRQEAFSLQVDPASSRVVTIDVYNAQARWGVYPAYPIEITLRLEGKEADMVITPATSALEMVRTLGEPHRKGGGDAGGTTAKALGPAAWLEWVVEGRVGSTATWTTLYIMAEYAGEAARAKDRWEPGRTSASHWATIALSLKPANDT